MAMNVPDSTNPLSIPTSRWGAALLLLAAVAMGGCGAKDSTSVSTSVELNVSGTGSSTGSGTVIAAGGLACTIVPAGKSGDCLVEYASGSTVTLSASAATGSTFTGWGGACSGTAATCQLTLTASTNVQASFGAAPQTVTVAMAGSGNGSVGSAPAGLACVAAAGTTTGTCAAMFPSGSSVVLTATPGAQSVFGAWSGDCSGVVPSCTLVASATRSAQATFLALRTFTVAGSGAGSGVVSSLPTGIACTLAGGVANGDCTEDYADGTSVTLTAAAASGSSFSGWGGACTGSAATCVLTAASARAVTVAFVPLRTLTITGAGAGAGVVTSIPAGITCSIGAGIASGPCTADYTDATAVTLTATPTAGSTFAGWTGACTGTSTCVVAMTVARAATAMFNGASSASTTLVAIAPATIVAGGSGATVTVTVRDAAGNPTAGASVVLSVSSGAALTMVQPVGVTGANGVATGTVSSSVAGARTIAATINGSLVAAQQPTVTVTAASVSASTSTVSVSPATLTAGGAAGTVTITAKDAFGNPVAGATASLSVGSGAALSVVQPAGVTNASGVVTGTVASTVAGARTVAALINGTTAVAPLANVTVNPAAANSVAQSGGFTATGSRFGQGVATLPSVVVRDAFANPVPGVAVTFTVARGLSTLGNGTTTGASVSVTTDASGIATLSSWTLASVAAAGNYNSAIDVNNTVNATVAGVAGPVSFTTSVAVSYATDVQTIWSAGATGSCTSAGCHASGGNAPVLVAGLSRANLAGNPAYWSSGDSTTMSNSTNRLLYRLVSGAPIMPSGFAHLPANVVGIIKAYIKQGVPNN